MEIYIAESIREESGPGSSAHSEIILFSTEEKRQVFVNEWHEDQRKMRHQKSTQSKNCYCAKDWIYELGLYTLELDCYMSHGRVIKRY